MKGWNVWMERKNVQLSCKDGSEHGIKETFFRKIDTLHGIREIQHKNCISRKSELLDKKVNMK